MIVTRNSNAGETQVKPVPNGLAMRDLFPRKLHRCRLLHKWPRPYLSLSDGTNCCWCSYGTTEIGSVALIKTGSDIQLWSNYLKTRGDSQNLADSPLHAARLQESICRRKLSFLSILREKFEQRKCSSLMNHVEYTYAQLLLFCCLASTSCFLLAKQILYSSLWTEKGLLDDARKSNVTQSSNSSTLTATPFDRKSIHYLDYEIAQSSFNKLVKQMVSCYLLNDMFAKFSNSRIFNLIGMTLLAPSAVVRLEQLYRLLGELLFRSNSLVPQSNFSNYTQSINTVQLNLSYLCSLRTTTHNWVRLVTESWHHKHPCSNLKNDLEQVLEDASAKTLSSLNLKTKLYLYNMIHFDLCYTKYFVSLTSYLNKRSDNNNGTASMKMVAANSKSHTKDMFVAKPIHRIDLDHMAWLLLMLLVLYVVGSLSILLPTLCSAAIELSIQNFEQLTFLNIFRGLNEIKTSQSLSRLMQMFAWQTLIILAIFDLLNFYSCCIICFSRAAYLKKRLEQIADSCRSLEGIFLEKCRSIVSNIHCEMEDDPVSHYNALLVITHLQHQQVLNLHQQKRNCHSELPSSPISSKQPLEELSDHWEQIRIINNQLELIIDWVSLAQQELIDVNKFFTNYLNLEIFFKVLCLVYVLSAFISKRSQLFESCFLLVNGNTAFTPIMIVVVMASLIEYEFKGICRQLNHIMIYGRKFLTLRNRRQLVIQADYLSIKNNRSFVLGGYFALTLGSLMPVVGWIATGIVLLQRNQE